VRDQIRRARVFDTRRHAISDAKALLHLAQNHNPAVRRQRPPSNLATIALPETADSPGSGSIGSFMAGVALRKSRGSFTNTTHVEAASTLAVIAASHEPLLFLTADLSVIAASASFCRTFQVDAVSVRGRTLSDRGAGEWAMPQLGSLLRATASGSAQIEAYEIDLIRKGQAPRSEF
jgi:hypothetical protein